jgi:hypothetical protein
MVALKYASMHLLCAKWWELDAGGTAFDQKKTGLYGLKSD